MKQRGFLIDLDGTIYLGEKRIPKAKEWVDYMQEEQIPFLFVTNNATRSPQKVQAFLREYHDIHVSMDHIYTSVDATVCAILQDKQFQKKKSAYVLGSDYLKEELSHIDLCVNDKETAYYDYAVVGLDKEATYDKIASAALAVRSGARFYLTNPDLQLPDKDGIKPGAGSLGKIVELVSDQAPVVCGKPAAIFIEGALKRIGLKKEEVLLLGDNLLTDIACAVNNGLSSILIETGVHKETDTEKIGIHPTYCVKNYEELFHLWNKN